MSARAARLSGPALARRAARAVVLPLISIVCGFVVAGVAVVLTGANPLDAYTALFQGAFTIHNAFTETLVASIPYVFLGLGVAFGFRAGLFNIGADGQFYLGAIFGVYIGYAVHVPGILHVPLTLAAGMLGGAIWGGIPGALKARFGAHEVIVTIMLNYIAYSLANFLINGGPMRDPAASAPQTRYIAATAQLPIVPGSRLHLGLLLALVAVPVVWYLIDRTTIGFRVRGVGLNAPAARTAGISVGWTILLTMAISGSLAGLAGATEISGVSHFMPAGFSIGYGFDAIAVALLARSKPWAVLPAAFLFGAMRNGATFMQLQTQVSSDLISIVQATVIMFIAAPALVRWLFRIRTGSVAEAQITQRAASAASEASTTG
ncbi:MAG: ABC transporter permease [Candidatus Dormibacteraeota bacterium]|nr:ABC transporter permease [Candidatus Dormibacteraeota bacterium]